MKKKIPFTKEFYVKEAIKLFGCTFFCMKVERAFSTPDFQMNSLDPDEYTEKFIAREVYNYNKIEGKVNIAGMSIEKALEESKKYSAFYKGVMLGISKTLKDNFPVKQILIDYFYRVCSGEVKIGNCSVSNFLQRDVAVAFVIWEMKNLFPELPFYRSESTPSNFHIYNIVSIATKSINERHSKRKGLSIESVKNTHKKFKKMGFYEKDAMKALAFDNPLIMNSARTMSLNIRGMYKS